MNATELEIEGELREKGVDIREKEGASDVKPRTGRAAKSRGGRHGGVKFDA